MDNNTLTGREAADFIHFEGDIGLTDAEIRERLGAGTPPNQVYKESGSKKSFKDWINSMVNKGYLEEAISWAERIKSLFGGSAPEPDIYVPPAEEKKTRILGLNPWVAAGIGVVLIGTLIYGATRIGRKS